MACTFQGSLYVGNFARVVIFWVGTMPVLYPYDVVMFVLINKYHSIE